MGDELKWLLKRGVGVFSKTFSLKNRPTLFESSTQICRHNPSLTCYLLPNHTRSRDSPSFAYMSSPAPAALHSTEVGVAAWVWCSPLLWCAMGGETGPAGPASVPPIFAANN